MFQRLTRQGLAGRFNTVIIADLSGSGLLLLAHQDKQLLHAGEAQPAFVAASILLARRALGRFHYGKISHPRSGLARRRLRPSRPIPLVRSAGPRGHVHDRHGSVHHVPYSRTTFWSTYFNLVLPLPVKLSNQRWLLLAERAHRYPTRDGRYERYPAERFDELGSKLMKQASILIVEDEALIRMMLVEMVEDLGHKVVGEAGRIDEAQSLAETLEYDLAILDIHLHGANAEPVAQVVRSRGRLLFFLSGYGSNGIPIGFDGTPTLDKPCTPGNLKRMIDAVLSNERPEQAQPP
ncbi:response regulator [Bradyrhizobium sp.]|uniref:response regulator n=1 Tax=Bradyrhizobium sp. TaxID=376 RepID=UPI0025BF3D8C|nr:response regulator [Bradyrhizobium sp.]